MAFCDQASNTFPNVDWHGSSHIHVSVSAGSTIDLTFDQRPMILYVLSEKHVGDSIWRYLMKRFGHMEWLIEQSTFTKLFLVDVDRNLLGMPTSESPDRIQNPVTQNYFHRIALLDNYVGGIRFWAEGYGDYTQIGFRFRLVKINGEGEEQNVREEARRRETIVSVEVQSAYDAILEINEPPSNMEAIVEDLINAIEEQ